MANQTKSNPIVADTAASLWSTGVRYVREIQWIDDAADIADSDDLNITINGAVIAAAIQVGTTGGGTPVENVSPNVGNLCVWRVGPFNPGIPVDNFVITTIDHGSLLIWTD